MDIQTQQAIANIVMEKIWVVDPHAIIAGGAPRDWYFGNLASDLDVFFYKESPLYSLEEVQHMLKKCGFRTKFMAPSANFGEGVYQRNPYLLHVFNCTYKMQKIQFIRMKSKTFNSVIPYFPLNISKIWYKNGEIHTTPDFQKAVKFKAIVKVSKLYADGDKYIQKIRAKFPKFKYFKSYELLAESLLEL